MGKSRSTGRRPGGASFSVFGVGGGVSIATTTTDRDISQALVTFLEDRRVLFNPDYLEIPSQVDHSVQEIRRELTEALQQLDPKSSAVKCIRAVRAACRRFLDEPRREFRHLGGRGYREHDDPGFFLALGELRATFGLQLKQLDELFSLDIETHLRDVFPAADEPI